MNNITCVEQNQCCGCGACYNKYPVGAITMQENTEGFLVPTIDEEKCTNCGLCKRACPSLNTEDKNSHTPECYAAMADDEIRMKSSSGGMFTLIAEYILDKGGYVCGAAFDTDWSVHHIIVDNKEDLAKLRGSKYVQSNTEKCYSEIKELLNNDKYVLFSGCPCQVAGLYSFLGKEYENLLTLELLCHGSPNFKIFKKYLDEIHSNKEIYKLEFRDKTLNWRSDNITIYHDKGIDICNIKDDPYENGFHKGLYNRKSCAPCKYAKLPRIADFTIADFWNIERIDKSLYDPKGVSLLVLNNTKSKRICKELKFKTKKKIALEDIKKTCNVTLFRPLEELFSREKFFKNLNKLTFKKNVDMCVNNRYDVCYISMFYGRNYGTILVSYAVHRIIEKLGYSILTLQKPSFIWTDHEIEGTIPTIFAQKHYNISRVYNSTADLQNLNNHCSNFIVGSDQQFYNELNFDIAYLDYVKNYKNKIAFGTSFGKENYCDNKELINKRRYLFKRFNHVALREVSDYLTKELFDIDAIEIIDPTLILPKVEFDKIAEKGNVEISEPYLLTYTLDLNEEKLKAIQYIAEKLNLKIINISNLDQRGRRLYDSDKDKIYTPEEFLHLYKNAAFVVTDSYHGSCFSIKFNKQFVSFVNNDRGSLRYKMFKQFGLNNRFLNDANDIYASNVLNETIDYEPINKTIEEKAKFAIDWLKNALENNNSKEKFTDFENYQDIILKEITSKLQYITDRNNELNTRLADINLLANKHRVKFKYYTNKIRLKLRWGGTQPYLQEQTDKLHEYVRRIRRLEKEGLPNA